MEESCLEIKENLRKYEGKTVKVRSKAPKDCNERTRYEIDFFQQKLSVHNK